MEFRFSPGRGPATAGSAMVATSQVPGTLAAVDILKRGGNAVDAAVAAAAVLCVTEPMSTGIGGDAFAFVWDGEQVHGLDAAGPAPMNAATAPIADTGPRSVVVPGAVAGWYELSERLGRIGFDACLAPAIGFARDGAAAGFHCAAAWGRAEHAPAELGPPPRMGEVFRSPELAASLELIAAEGPKPMYAGRLAEAIAASTWLEESDLAAYSPRWVEPLRMPYRGVEILEMPPPTQGVAALEGLGLLEGMEVNLGNQVRAVSLALHDAFERVRDGAAVADLLDPAFLADRRRVEAILTPELPAGTVYLCVVDGDGMAVSFIQSLYGHFGSGVVAPGTGITLNNRVACFKVGGKVEPGRRPYHTIIPGMMFRDGELFSAFGVMGAFIQAQAHVQLVSALVDDGLDPQAALDRPRFRIEDGWVALEEGHWPNAGELRTLGYEVREEQDRFKFGGGQAIVIDGGRLLGGSDPRKDGFAAGI